TLTFTQSLEDIGITKAADGSLIYPRRSDKRFPVGRVRRALTSYGWRGEKLRKELDRIVAGPDVRNRETFDVSDARVVYPYGWEKRELTREMRRMFPRNSGKRNMLVLDELHLFFNRKLVQDFSDD
ncbi:hypothetical protein LSB85_004655, partial [Salmonella enterica]|nr:hypothetical protein [Salmonella enterica]